jgi:YidC/Oxa1 family membrane protein insertase
MHLAWGPLDWVAKFMLVALIMLKGFCGSYGWAIIVLTIIVRIVFWPVTQKANNSMKKMQKLQPMVTEIKAKFKDNPQQMNAKVMELYKIEKVNPLGGCLPILLQIPVFFALYATLDGAVELRQVPFLWATDLSRPDTIAVIFGLPLNPLVLVMTALMVLQQKMTPAPADPMQQKMMMFMPVVMLFVLYSLPSGLTLYWTVSQVFSILQLYMTQKMGKDQPAADKSQNNSLKKA